jgi:hypothetical protein
MLQATQYQAGTTRVPRSVRLGMTANADRSAWEN